MARAYRHYLMNFYLNKETRKEERAMVRVVRDPMDLSLSEFQQNYKISQEMVDYLCRSLDVDLAPRAPTGNATIYKVLSSLKVLLSGNYQRGVGNEVQTCVAQTTVSKYLHQFLDSVHTRLTPQWIEFPGTVDSREQVAARFEEKFGLPHILGCIDCTHVQIFTPPKPHHAQYLNRHGVTSLNVQLVADADCRILNVNANWPGRVHDQFIFNQSIVNKELQRLYNNRIVEYYLLGDSGYGLQPWLMTPIRNSTPATPERAYTEWHCRARNTIERTNGYLKGTFRCLGVDRSLHYSIEQAAKMIYACCTLYNIMKHYRIPMQFVEPTIEERRPPDEETRLYETALRKRDQIVRNYFT